MMEDKEETMPDKAIEQFINGEFNLEEILTQNPDKQGDILGQLGLAQLLNLPDEQFETLSENFLIELESAFNASEFQLLLAQVMRENAMSSADIERVFDEAQATLHNESLELPKAKADFLSRFFAIFLNAVMSAEDAARKIIKIPVEITRDTQLPQYARIGDAGMDIYATEDVTIAPGETKIVPTGLKMAIPQGYAILIQPRSGLSAKSKLRVANTPGLIDSGYRDEIGVIVENIEPRIVDIDVDYEKSEPGAINVVSILYGKDYTITKGQRIAQMRLVEAPSAALFEVDDINDVIGFNRGGGFGHSGDF